MVRNVIVWFVFLSISQTGFSQGDLTSIKLKANLLRGNRFENSQIRLRREGDAVEWIFSREKITWQELLEHLPFYFSSLDSNSPGTFRFEVFFAGSPNSKKQLTKSGKLLLEKHSAEAGFFESNTEGLVKKINYDDTEIVFPEKKEQQILVKKGKRFDFHENKFIVKNEIDYISANGHGNIISFSLTELLERNHSEPVSIIVEPVFRKIIITYPDGEKITIRFRYPYEALQSKSFLSEVFYVAPDKKSISLFRSFEADFIYNKVIPSQNVEQFIESIHKIKPITLSKSLAKYDYSRRYWRYMQSKFPEERQCLSPNIIDEVVEYYQSALDTKNAVTERRLYDKYLFVRQALALEKNHNSFGYVYTYSGVDRWMREELMFEKFGPKLSHDMNTYFIKMSKDPSFKEIERSANIISLLTFGFPEPDTPRLSNVNPSDESYTSHVFIQSLVLNLYRELPLPDDYVEELIDFISNAELTKATLATQILACMGHAGKLKINDVSSILTQWDKKVQGKAYFVYTTLLECLAESREGRKLIRKTIMEGPNKEEHHQFITSLILYRRAYSCILCQEFSSYDENEANNDLKWCLRVIQKNKKSKVGQ